VSWAQNNWYADLGYGTSVSPLRRRTALKDFAAHLELSRENPQVGGEKNERSDRLEQIGAATGIARPDPESPLEATLFIER
jgi:hypothetical protein